MSTQTTSRRPAPTNSLVPSFLAKVSRAKKHLADLEAAVEQYRAGHPYGAVECVENKKKVWRLRFSASPENTQIPIIAADLTYNLRSSLDHLAAALVPASHASHVAFPIFWPDVWGSPVPGENEQLAKDRSRWNTYTRRMRPEAVAILRKLQPDQDVTFRVHHLLAINRLSNTDRHTKFPVFAVGLKNPVGKVDGKLGKLNIPGGVPEGYHDSFLEADSEIGFPQLKEPPAHVEVEGIPIVIIRFTEEQGNVEIPDTFTNAINFIETEVVAPLIPYLWVRA
jgi:hypothetical protein